MKNWFAVYTQAKQEYYAVSQLRAQNFDTYLPQYQKLRRHAGRAEIVATPLFPRYIFVALDMKLQRWRSINGTRGVVGLVAFADQPASIPEHVIAALQNRENEAGFICLNKPQFQRGQTLRIVDGPMANTQALFDEMADRDRAFLLVSLLGRMVRTCLPARNIHAA